MTQSQNSAAPIELAAYIGIDWADQKHAVCLSVAGSEPCERSEMQHTPEALADWIASLRSRFGGRPVGICLEQTRGGLIYALLPHEFIVLYPINPVTATRYRQAFIPSGAKDDPVDAHLLWEVLVKHRDHLRPWTPDDPATRKLALLCEHRRKLVNGRTALVQRLGAALKAYFPQALHWAGDDLASPMACDFLLRWPTLADLQKAQPQTLRRFYYSHRCRRPDRIAERLTQIRTARPLTTDNAVVEAHALLAITLAQQLRTLLPSIGAYDKQIAALFATHPDAAIFESFPGAGAALAPRLLAAFGTHRDRFPQPESMQQLSGIAPVTERSGTTKRVHRRYACARFLLQTFHEFARCSRAQCAWAAAYYQAQRAAGKGHHAALRALAFKWLRILWRCWRNREPYREAAYLESLRRNGSPLTSLLQPSPV